MKFIFASLIALTFLSASAQSTEHLNKELMKSKEVYFEAVIEAIALDAMARSGGLEDAVKFEPPNNMHPKFLKDWFMAIVTKRNAEKTIRESCLCLVPMFISR